VTEPEDTPRGRSASASHRGSPVAEPTATRGSGRLVAALGGVLAATLALAVAELVAGLLPGAASPITAVADGVIAATPGAVVSLAIDLFGAANRAVLLGSILVVIGAAGAAIGLAARRWRAAPAVGLSPFVAIGVTAGLADASIATTTAVAAPVLGAAAAVAMLDRWPGSAGAARSRSGSSGSDRDASTADTASLDGPTRSSDRRGPSSPIPRRDVLGWGLATAAAATVFAVGGRMLQARSALGTLPEDLAFPLPPEPLPSPAPTTSFDVDGLSPLLTPNDRFFRIDTAFSLPRIDPTTHVVRFTGLVDRPFSITYEELLARADTEADITLTCVSNEVGGDLVGTARWFGVPLDQLLEEAQVRPEATQIVGRAVDGWTGGFPVEVLDGRPALVAVGMNGEPLPVRHGFPVRLTVPGLYGYVSDTKWLSEIELTTFDAYDAYWIRRGWAREGPVKTQSRIDVPSSNGRVPAGTVVVAGVAWAGERGITRVEVRVDEGPWAEAELTDELAATSWRQWRLLWDAPAGDHRIAVRATDGEGATQTEEVSRPAPDGATGHHTIQVTVT
jgi:DMSO/TMAO reductase YedYZ molybdopterin-dependent catalytic subunit